ncbi:MAG TPA: DUF502 domain-containing protein, partial [Patescibacteria group bacterium]|nr:DUF502 domain-containing protein [Patescibacteria group bacterium]
GLIVLVPIAITAFVTLNVFTFTENLMGRYLPVHFPGLALVVVMALIVLIGWLSSHWLLKSLLEYAERLVDSIPIVKFIYSSVKQIATTVFESQRLLENAVLIPYPHAGVKALGFVMTEPSEPVAAAFSEEHLCVFVPMSLNLTAGVNVFVPKKDVIPLEVTSESALQYILTAGAVMPKSPEVSRTDE